MAHPDRLGRYNILETIGSGAMGEVYRAVDTNVFDKVVAVKVLLPKLFENETARRRFETEVRTAATLDHPNIVAIFDRGEDGEGRPYFVMEYLEGFDLKLLTTGTEERSSEFCVEMGRQIADALDYAHGRGVIHRDIKPSNIFVARRGSDEIAKLLDFGIVHIEGSEMTHTMDQPGTPIYQAPEVHSGQEATGRSDLFSLGIVLYELFTHVHPFQADTMALTMMRMLRDSPERPRKHNPDMPHQLESIILRMLDKDPEQRPESPREIADALRDIGMNMRAFGSSGTPSGISADQVTQQAVGTMIERARRFESEGDMAQALSLWEKAVVLAPENPKLSRKRDRLKHQIESRAKIESLLGEAERLLGEGDLEGVQQRLHDVYLIDPEHPDAAALKRRLEQAHAAQPEVNPDLLEIYALEKKDKSKARKRLIGYLKNNPGDRLAAQALDDLLKGRPLRALPSVGAPAPVEAPAPAKPTPPPAPPEPPPAPPAPPKVAPAPPAPPEPPKAAPAPPKPVEPPPAPKPAAAEPEPAVWTPEQRGAIEALVTRAGTALKALRSAKIEEVAGLEAALGHCEQLKSAAADPAAIEAAGAQLDEAVAGARVVVRSRVDALIGSLDKGLARAEGTDPAILDGARERRRALAAIDETSAIEAAARAVAEARRAVEALGSATTHAAQTLAKRIDTLPDALGAPLRKRAERLAAGRGDETLASLTAAIDAAEGEGYAAVGAELADWIGRVEGSGAVEPAALERFGAIAAELQGGDPAAARRRVATGQDAIAAVKSAHGTALASLEERRAAAVAGLQGLASALSPAERKRIDARCGEALGERLVEAGAQVEALERSAQELEQRHRAEIEARRAKIAAAVEAARGALDDPWLEARVDPIERATEESAALLEAAGAAASARSALDAAIAGAGDPALAGDEAVAAVEQASAAAASAAAASRKRHEKSVAGESERAAATLADLERWRQGRWPKKIARQLERLEIPAAPSKPGPAEARAYVQAVSGAAVALAQIDDKVRELEPEYREDANGLIERLAKAGRGRRLPPLGAERGAAIEAARVELQTTLADKRADLGRLVVAVERAEEALDRVPFNHLLWLAPTVVVLVLGAAGWFAFAPRQVSLSAGLGTERIWLVPEGKQQPVEVEPGPDGRFTFGVRPGSYEVHYRTSSGDRVLDTPVSVGLFSTPAPAVAHEGTVGDRPQDRIFEVLQRELPKLLAPGSAAPAATEAPEP